MVICNASDDRNEDDNDDYDIDGFCETLVLRKWYPNT